MLQRFCATSYQPPHHPPHIPELVFASRLNSEASTGESYGRAPNDVLPIKFSRLPQSFLGALCAKSSAGPSSQLQIRIPLNQFLRSIILKTNRQLPFLSLAFHPDNRPDSIFRMSHPRPNQRILRRSARHRLYRPPVPAARPVRRPRFLPVRITRHIIRIRLIPSRFARLGLGSQSRLNKIPRNFRQKSRRQGSPQPFFSVAAPVHRPRKHQHLFRPRHPHVKQSPLFFHLSIPAVQ